MAEQPKSIDISDVPEILRLVEEVHRAGEPRVLRKDGEDLAMVVPLPRREKRRLKKPTEADYEAFRSAAGGWADVDTDTLIEDIYRARQEGTRPDSHYGSGRGDSVRAGGERVERADRNPRTPVSDIARCGCHTPERAALYHTSGAATSES